MTIIVYKDGVLAADSGGFCGNVMIAEDQEKIYRLPDGSLAGAAGHTPDVQAFRKWAEGGFRPEDKPDPFEDFGALVVEPDGTVARYNVRLERWVAGTPWHVEGCAEEFAFGLLAAGLSATEVVEKAIKHHIFCGGAVRSIQFDAKPAETVFAPIDLDAIRTAVAGPAR